MCTGLQHFIQDKCFLAFGNLTSCYGSTLLRHLETLNIDFFFSVLQTHSSWEQLEGCLLQVGVYILSRAAGEGLCLPLLRGVWRRSGEMGLTVQDPPVC